MHLRVWKKIAISMGMLLKSLSSCLADHSLQREKPFFLICTKKAILWGTVEKRPGTNASLLFFFQKLFCANPIQPKKLSEKQN